MKGGKQKTISRPSYPEALRPVAATEADLYGNVLQPLETSWIQRLLGLVSGNPERRAFAASPQLRAAMQAAAALGGAGMRFGGGVSPDAVAQLRPRLLGAMTAAAPEALAGFGGNLIDPRFLSLFQPTTEQETTGGGGSSTAQALETAAAVAKIALMFL